MLRQRVITALILAGALIVTLLSAPYPMQATLFALVAAAGGWEWAALVGAKGALLPSGLCCHDTVTVRCAVDRLGA